MVKDRFFFLKTHISHVIFIISCGLLFSSIPFLSLKSKNVVFFCLNLYEYSMCILNDLPK